METCAMAREKNYDRDGVSAWHGSSDSKKFDGLNVCRDQLLSSNYPLEIG
jgi:hypothetical protein